MNYDEHLISIFAIRLILFYKIHTIARTRYQPWKKDWQWHDEILRRNKLGVNPKCVLQLINAQLHGFICIWTHNLIKVLRYRHHLSFLLHSHADVTEVTNCYEMASIVVRCPLTFFYQKLLSQSWPNLLCSIFRVRRQEIVNCITLHPKAR